MCQLVFISRPDHMQITPDTEGYLSIRYSKSTYSTNMAAGNLGQGALIINDMNTSPVLKQQKGATQLTAKYSKGNTARCEPQHRDDGRQTR